MTAVVASFFTKNHAEMQRRWLQEGGLPAVPGSRVHNPLTTGAVQTPAHLQLETPRPRYRLLADDDLGPAALGDLRDAGCVQVFDWATKQPIWESTWGTTVYTPSGFCFGERVMYLNDLEGSSIFTVDLVDQPGRLLRRISHPYLNDIHGLTRTRRGLLVASTGTDLVVELDADGNLVYEWWAADHGFDESPAGRRRANGRGQEHRDRFYHTRMQTTHLNAARFRDDGEQLMLVVLFHQGQIIEVDRGALPGSRPRVLADGLARPHGLRRFEDGWLIADSARAELVFYDAQFRRTGRVAIPEGGWLQDVTVLSTGRVLVNDVDNHCMVELDPASGQIVERVAYHRNWRMGELAELPPTLAAGFLRRTRH